MEKVHLGDTRLSRSELLSINHIYYFDAGERNDIFSHLLHLSDDVLEAMVEDIDRDDQYKPLSPQSKECLDIFEESMQDADFARVKNLLKTKYDRTGEDKNVVQILENIYHTYDNTNIAEVDEDRFSDIVFKPIFGHIVRGIPYARIDGQFTPLNNQYRVRADATVSMKVEDEDIRALVAEVKPPTKSSDQDFFNVAVEMKIMLDAMVARNVPDPTVFGVLVEGFTMHTFKMDLKFNKLYRFINLKTCYLPRSRADMGVLRGTLRSCNQLKSLLEQSVANLRKEWVEDNQAVLRRSWTRGTSFVPTSTLNRSTSD